MRRGGIDRLGSYGEENFSLLFSFREGEFFLPFFFSSCVCVIKVKAFDNLSNFKNEESNLVIKL